MKIVSFIRPRTLGKVHVPTVTLAHGGGGRAMKDLIDDVFVEAFDNAALAPLEDQARFDLAALAARGDRLAFTTDSYVVKPMRFPGGSIGELAVNGTVNDLAVSGAKPVALSLSLILEEGLAAGKHDRGSVLADAPGEQDPVARFERGRRQPGARVAPPDPGRAHVHAVGVTALDHLRVAGDDLDPGLDRGARDRVYLGLQVLRRKPLLEDQRQAEGKWLGA